VSGSGEDAAGLARAGALTLARAGEAAGLRPSAAPPASTQRDAPYLSFVDGLRAISIVAVVGCHVGLPGFAGGFVGVDVFFVISGFLIINQIKDGLEAKRFSVATFYARRALRILPPFLIMFAAVVAVAPFVIPTPNDSLEFARSAPFSALMAANVFFYLRQGYFDIDAKSKPLLHTWTLSVEEQFYLLIPIALVIIFHLRGRRASAGLLAAGVVVGVISLVGAITQTETDPHERNAAFYFTHWRMWEFIIGGMIGAPLVAAARRLPSAATEILGLAGLVLIVCAIALFDSGTPYPSWRALLPVAGAGFVIVSGLARPQALAARLLALRFMVGIGLVSYAWYLWHWPILTFIRFSGDADWLLGNLLGAGVLAFLIACASYVLVERPIRRWKRLPGALRHPGRIALTGVAAGTGAAALGGLAALGGYLWLNSVATSTYAAGRDGFDSGCQASDYSTSAFPERCFGGHIAVLMGDSLANAMFPAFARRFNELGLSLIYMGRGGCDPLLLTPTLRPTVRKGGCASLYHLFDQLLAHTATAQRVSVIATPRLEDRNTPARWNELIGQFDPAHSRVLLLGPSPAFPMPATECVILSDRYALSRERCGRPRSEVERLSAPYDAPLVKVAASRPESIRFISPIDVFCDAQTCRPFIGNKVLYDDGYHLWTSGVDLVWKAFESDFRWVAWK